MESTSKYKPALLMESTTKQIPPWGIYARFLELPVPIVLAVMWIVGVALISVCASSPSEVACVLAADVHERARV
jgi:hypothetical protein